MPGPSSSQPRTSTWLTSGYAQSTAGAHGGLWEPEGGRGQDGRVTHPSRLGICMLMDQRCKSGVRWHTSPCFGFLAGTLLKTTTSSDASIQHCRYHCCLYRVNIAA